jgi:hypothetical protein
MAAPEVLWVIMGCFALILILIPIYYRRQIMLLISGGYAGYKEQKKFDELYARLDRNKEGKYNHKQYLKHLEVQKKNQMKKNRDATAERKSVKEK